MAESLDVYVVIEKGDLIWIGSASAKEGAMRVIHDYSRKAPGFFVVHSQKSGHRSFYFAGGDYDAKRNLNFRPAC
jgi:hypothetical protein